MESLGLSTIICAAAPKRCPYRFKQDPPLDPIQLQANIDAGIVPLRNTQGSSGNYRLRNLNGHPVAIFKPASEEPYAQANPRWSKWIQRYLLPCSFGRSCLPLGHGWLSERAAWLVDDWLGLGIVPRTDLVSLHSCAFSLSGAQWGSMQEWVMGFRPAPQVLHDIARMPQEHLALSALFLEEFQRLVILDTLIGNTDRNLDNWLIHLSWRQTSLEKRVKSSALISTSTSDTISLSPMASIILNPVRSNITEHKDPRLRMEPIVKIAAIDNGLAFPHLTPNRRSYQCSWLWMAQSNISFLPHSKILERISDNDGWDSLATQLLQLFEPTGHGPTIVGLMYERRVKLVDALKQRLTPWDLVNGQLETSCFCL